MVRELWAGCGSESLVRKFWGRCDPMTPKKVLGERGRIRTCDPCLKRALLYQLSYAPHLCNQALAEIARVHVGPIIAITFRCASRFTGISPCVYVSSVTLLSACRNDSCTVFTSSPFPLRSVANECLNTCQRTCFTIPASFAAGRMCFDIAELGNSGCLPCISADAKT